MAEFNHIKCFRKKCWLWPILHMLYPHRKEHLEAARKLFGIWAHIPDLCERYGEGLLGENVIVERPFGNKYKPTRHDRAAAKEE